MKDPGVDLPQRTLRAQRNRRRDKAGTRMKKIFVMAVLLFSTFCIAQQPQSNTARISIPGVQGVLELNVGPTSWKTKNQNDRKLVELDTAPRPDRVQVTAFLWQVGFPASADRCRDE